MTPTGERARCERIRTAVRETVVQGGRVRISRARRAVSSTPRFRIRTGRC